MICIVYVHFMCDGVCVCDSIHTHTIVYYIHAILCLTLTYMLYLYTILCPVRHTLILYTHSYIHLRMYKLCAIVYSCYARTTNTYTLLYTMHTHNTLLHIHTLIHYTTLLYYTIHYYTIHYYTILYTTILYYTLLYYTILYTTILYYTLLYYTIHYYTIHYYTILYYTIHYFTHR